MNDEQIKEIQNIILAIFKEFKRVCEKNNLKYFAIGGTAIGAVRHQGFIPWDDDIDVVMPIEDYNKFRSIAKEELKPKYEILDPLNRLNSHNSFIKIMDTTTTMVESSEINDVSRYKGIWIDVFPICGCPKNLIKQKILKWKFYWDYKFDLNINFQEFKDRTLKGKIFRVLTYIIRKNKKKDYYIKKWEKNLVRFNFDESNNVLFPWRIPLNKKQTYKNIFPYEYFRSGVEINFEDVTICCPIEYDQYLRMDFGDYMKLPPKEKQVPRHKIEILNLSKSYIEYAKENKDHQI